MVSHLPIYDCRPTTSDTYWIVISILKDLSSFAIRDYLEAIFVSSLIFIHSDMFFEHLLCAGSPPLYQEYWVNLMNEIPAHKELIFQWREKINKLSKHK